MNALDKLEGPPVPLLVDGVLPAEGVRQLFADLADHTLIHKLREKGGKTVLSPDSDSSPMEACKRLLAGEIFAVQVLYHFDGSDWTDTLMRTPQGIRVVRCQHSTPTVNC